MTSLTLDNLQLSPESICPLPGRCIIEIEPHEEKIGSLFVPDRAREHKSTDVFLFGRVVAIGYGDFYERENKKDQRAKYKRIRGVQPSDVEVGSRVVFSALMQDLNQTRVLTSVSRINAVIE